MEPSFTLVEKNGSGKIVVFKKGTDERVTSGGGRAYLQMKDTKK